MGQRLTRNSRVTRVRIEDGQPVLDTRADTLTVEEPLQIRVDGQDLSTTMRTPGHDFELVHGFLHAEGVIHSREDVTTMRYCAGAVGPHGENTYNTIDVALTPVADPDSAQSGTLDTQLDPQLGAQLARQPLPIRHVTITSACGICGTTSIDQIVHQRRHPIVPVTPTAEFVLSLPHKLREQQKTFRRTGGIHAAAAVTSEGRTLVVREDVGRHNAADKVIGALLMEGALPAEEVYLVMSSRASFELVQKAVLAGFSGLVAVSAATSLAVDLAREAGLFMTGFTRDDRFNVYSGALSEQVRDASPAHPAAH